MDKDEKKTINVQVGNLLSRYRLFLLSFLVVIVLVVIVGSIVLYVHSANTKKGIEKVENLSFELSKITDFDNAPQSEKDELIAKATDLTKKYSGIVKLRAAFFVADLEFRQEHWEKSLEMWKIVAETDKKAYTNGLAWFNAAVCAENLSNFASAEEYLTYSVNAPDFPLVSRAWFNLARIQEVLDNTEKATESYQKLVDLYAGSEWAKLAKTRLISLSLTK